MIAFACAHGLLIHCIISFLSRDKVHFRIILFETTLSIFTLDHKNGSEFIINVVTKFIQKMGFSLVLFMMNILKRRHYLFIHCKIIVNEAPY